MKFKLFSAIVICLVIIIGGHTTSFAGKYQTVQEEINATDSGQTVKIRPGVHPEILVLKNGVNLKFLNNAVVWGISDGGNEVYSIITGDGSIESPNGNAIFISHPRTLVFVMLPNVVASSGNGAFVTSGVLIITGNVTASGDGVKVVGDGHIKLNGNATCDAGAGAWAEIGGSILVYGNLVSRGSPAVAVYGGAKIDLYGNATGTDYSLYAAEAGTGGILQIFGGVVDIQSLNRRSGALSIHGGSKVLLNDVVLRVENPESYGIVGAFTADTVWCYSVVNDYGVCCGVATVGDCGR